MSGFIEGEDRNQATMFPERLDDYVAEDAPVRVIDVFIDDLDISGLGFRTQAKDTGRPAYHPSTMLKIYVYGYLNRVQSSRGLEREAQRNIELMWLTGRLAPDFKTIADFRKDNGEAIRLVCREFVMLCKKLNLLTHAFVAIDGSKFKAVNNRDRNFTRAKMKRRLAEVEASIDRYLSQLASADRAAPPQDNSVRLEDRVAALREEMARLKKLEVRMLKAPDKQISLTDSDARSMKSRGSGMVGYNVQTAVDCHHHLIIAHEVTNIGSDRSQLANMAEQTKAILNTETLEVVADRGYYNGDEIRACEQAGIDTYLPKPNTSGNKPKVSSTVLSSTTRQATMSMSVPPVSDSSIGSHELKRVKRSVATGAQRVRHARSKPNARPVTIDASVAGCMRRLWNEHKLVSRAHPTQCECEETPLNTRSAPSRPGWVRHTSQ